MRIPIRFKLARPGRRDALPVVVLVLAVLAFSATPAFAQGGVEPWWHLGFASQPSYIQPGHAADDVQRVTVAMSTGEFDLITEGVGQRLRGRSTTVALAVGATPAAVQAALEGPANPEEAVYGVGNVEVTSPCTGTPTPACPETFNRYEVYEIKFVGQWTDQYVIPMKSDYEQVNVVQAVRGRADGILVVNAVNLGDADTVGPFTLADKLPKGLTAVWIEAMADASTFVFGKKIPPVECKLGTLSCTFTGLLPPEFPNGIEFRGGYPSSVPPYDRVVMRVAVDASGATGGSVSNEASVTGGGAPTVTGKASIPVSAGGSVPYAISSYEQRPEEAGGGVDSQAGSHPFQYTTTSIFTENVEPPVESKPVALTKDLHFKLPPGVIGNPVPFAQCSDEDFAKEICPQDTVVGVAMGNVNLLYESKPLNIQFHEPLYNLEPAVGEPARFGFIVNEHGLGPEVPVLLKTAVRTGGDYGVTVNVSNISQVAEFFSSEVTFWGVPGDKRHNFSRGLGCLKHAYFVATNASPETLNGYPCPSFEPPRNPPPLMTLPTSCTGPLHTTLEADSWLEPAVLTSTLNTAPMPALDGCNRLPFGPEIRVSPDAQQASKPTGLTVDVHVPQEGQLNPAGLAQSNVKNIVVTLPDGVALNPSGGDGLSACSQAQIGFEGAKELHPEFEPGVSTLAFTPKLPGSYGSSEPLDPGVNFCPNASKIAEATIRTPLLPNPLKGFVYLAAPQNFAGGPQENPFETHVAMYLVAEDPVSGSLVKLPGSVELGGAPGVEGLAPGQIRATFADNPQLPFEDAELHFFGGERAPLSSPERCGKYTTNATFAPWSGGEPVSSQSSFEVTSGPNGSACPGAALPFSASLASGTTNNNAESYTGLDTTMSRADGQQPIQSITLHYPAGISGLLSSVKLCGEAEANAGTCGPESQIGETVVSVGVGGDPFTVTGGKVFITGPYEGAPFGLSITNPAKAGPFDLKEGRPVVVRAKIEVDPSTAALTITTDPSGSPFAIPTIIEGFPLQIQHVNVLVNRPGFTFNPSNCAPTAVTGVINSAEGAASPVSVPFQATNCAFLKFTPKFSVSTSGKTSRAGGASLTAKVTEPSEPFGSQANISKVKVELPKQLPSRLTTLQKACTAAQFEANPAGCPVASVIGHAKVITKLVPVPLEGPIYFVSHGGEAFPSLEIVLQGYGVKIVLVGATFISKAGITSTTFKTVPDQPFETFELTLPEGKYSALAANGSLCGQKLVMPNEFIGQNGAAIHENTTISVTGCAKVKALTRAQKLKAALKVCHKKAKGKRAACAAKARKQFGPIKKKVKKK
jgi:hypothetical protein